MTKRCPNCGVVKDVSGFNKNKTEKDGLQSHCKECRKIYYQAHKTELIKYSRKYNRTHKDKILKQQREYSRTEKGKLIRRKQDLKKSYNITLEDYDHMFEQQKGVCAICGKVDVTGRRLAVDHDHKTGKVRGLLCTRCNVRVGILEDREWRPLARKYLYDNGS